MFYQQNKVKLDVLLLYCNHDHDNFDFLLILMFLSDANSKHLLVLLLSLFSSISMSEFQDILSTYLATNHRYNLTFVKTILKDVKTSLS
jgi:hypothetical protein